MDVKTLLNGAIDAAHEAGALLRSGFGGVVEARSKEGRHNIVTQFDIASERLLQELLRKVAPGSSFLGEESGHHDGETDITWIVDPLDGTVNFAHGIPIFCVSIAAQQKDSIVAGVIYHPLLQETFTAFRGGGAFLNGEKITVSAISELNDSILVTGFPYNVSENPDKCINQFAALVGRGLPIRRLGSAALDLAYTAAGRFDGFWEVALHPWDMAAGVLLVEEAGGRVTHYDNREFSLQHDSIVATNGSIHNQLVNALGEVTQ